MGERGGRESEEGKERPKVSSFFGETEGGLRRTEEG